VFLGGDGGYSHAVHMSRKRRRIRVLSRKVALANYSLSMLSLLVAELATSFGKRGETPKVLATSATVTISNLNVDAD